MPGKMRALILSSYCRYSFFSSLSQSECNCESCPRRQTEPFRGRSRCRQLSVLWLDCRRGCEETGQNREHNASRCGISISRQPSWKSSQRYPLWGAEAKLASPETFIQRCQLWVLLAVSADVMNITDPPGCLVLTSMFFCMDPDRLSELPCFSFF